MLVFVHSVAALPPPGCLSWEKVNQCEINCYVTGVYRLLKVIQMIASDVPRC